MDKKVTAAIICVVAVGVGLGAYFLASPPQPEHKQPEQHKVTITDTAGRKVTLEVPVDRVVITFYNGDYVAVAGGKDPFKKIVGWNGKYWGPWNRSIWKKYKEAFPETENIPDVGFSVLGTFSVEKAISLKPDVVIMPRWGLDYGASQDEISKLKQAGIPVVLLDYNAETLEKHTKSTLLLGKILGKEERAKEIVEFYKEQVNKVYSRLEKINKPKPKVYVETTKGGPSEYGKTFGENYCMGALIERAGGINIAKGKVKLLASISPEYVLDANPDVIITVGSPPSIRLGYFGDPENSREFLKACTERPGWDTLNAVKNHRVYTISRSLQRHLPDFVIIQALAKWFYPEEFKDLNPVESFKEFHERYLPVNYSGVWMVSLEE